MLRSLLLRNRSAKEDSPLPLPSSPFRTRGSTPLAPPPPKIEGEKQQGGEDPPVVGTAEAQAAAWEPSWRMPRERRVSGMVGVPIAGERVESWEARDSKREKERERKEKPLDILPGVEQLVVSGRD